MSRYVLRPKHYDPMVHDELFVAEVTLSEGPDRDNETRGRILMETKLGSMFFTNFDEFYDRYEVIGKASKYECEVKNV